MSQKNLVVLVLACFCQVFAPSALALAIADSSIAISNLLIAPASGSLVFGVDSPLTSAFAQAGNSLGEADGQFAGPDANAVVTWAEGHGAASGLSDVRAASGVNLPGILNSAFAVGQGSLFGVFSITDDDPDDGIEAVDVTFSMDVTGHLHGFADGLGYFQTEIIASLSLDGSDLLFHHSALSGGPHFPDTTVPVAPPTLSNMQTLNFGQEYFLFLQADSESSAYNLPEPGTLALLLGGLAGLARLRRSP